MDRGLDRTAGPVTDDVFLDLVAGVYDAAIQPELWQIWLERLCRALRAPVGGLFLRFHPGLGVGGYFSVGVREDLRGWFLGGPIRDRTVLGDDFALKPGEFAILSEAVTRERFLRSRFYREWMRPQELRHGIGGLIERTSDSLAGIGAFRRAGCQGFGAGDLDLLRRLAPHVQRAIRVQGIRGLGELEREAAERVGDALRVGVLLASGSGQVLDISRRAAALLEMPDGPHVEDGRIVARTTAESHALRALLAGASRRQTSAKPRAGGALILSRSGRPGLFALVSPLRIAQALPAWAEPAVALVVLRAPEDMPVPSEAELQSLFCLTPAEARVACALAAGGTVQEIARGLGVRVTTVRTHVQRLLAKTGARRQSELVRLLVSGPWLEG